MKCRDGLQGGAVEVQRRHTKCASTLRRPFRYRTHSYAVPLKPQPEIIEAAQIDLRHDFDALHQPDALPCQGQRTGGRGIAIWKVHVETCAVMRDGERRRVTPGASSRAVSQRTLWRSLNI